ncbi:sporulation protein [Planococcus liqunii]|uniref:sporulation protein n=1 Tax=Planococcus liqunii TaxID=3058394 RepID=UPI00263400F1|nr:sporulation protein [Planococcus sp. N056]WKA50803.1 sporulation protein [Planococcus sp. N056]
MSIWETLRASAGDGNAKVGTSIAKAKVYQGSSISGEIYVIGGETEQEIKGAYIFVMTNVLVEEGGRKALEEVEIQKLKISGAFTIGPREEKTIPFAFELSRETPMTVHKVDVWLKTMLEVTGKNNLREEHDIHVFGTEAAEKILYAVQEMDFPLKKVVNVQSRRTNSGVLQEFEFYPNKKFKRRFSELELVLISDQAGTTAYIQLDKEERQTKDLLARELNGKETILTLHYPSSNVPGVDAIARQLHDLLLGKT